MQIKKEVRDFNLTHIFECGQCFRWEREEDGSYTGTACGRTVNLRLDGREQEGLPHSNQGGLLIIDGADEADFEAIWRPYFDLDRDYGKVKAALLAGGSDPVMRQAIEAGSGIRILRQDPWETLISFLISQNSNIPRIKKCIETLSALYGEPLPAYRGKRRYAFPTAERLAVLTEEALAPVRLGYRARYILETARCVAAEGDALSALPELPYEEGYAYLTGLCGVGPKVANCILLFAGAKYESFPIDVWMRRVMHRLYHIEENDVRAMASFAQARFGAYGGFAQQYLFYYVRGMEKFLKNPIDNKQKKGKIDLALKKNEC